MLSCFSRVQLFAALWTVAHQAPLSMGIPRQQYWSQLPFPSPGDLPHPGIEPAFLMSPAFGRWVLYYGLPWWLRGQSICYNVGGFDPWVRKIPWRRKWQPTPVFLPEKSHELRSLVGYSPWGRKESDTAERLH